MSKFEYVAVLWYQIRFVTLYAQQQNTFKAS